MVSEVRCERSHSLFVMLFYGFEPVAALLEYLVERLHGVGPKHGYARLLEIGYALEYGTCREVPAGVEYAPVFVDALHVDAQLLLEHVNLLVECQRVASLAYILELHSFPTRRSSDHRKSVV